MKIILNGMMFGLPLGIVVILLGMSHLHWWQLCGFVIAVLVFDKLSDKIVPME